MASPSPHRCCAVRDVLCRAVVRSLVTLDRQLGVRLEPSGAGVGEGRVVNSSSH
jgi:hypothetical protein